MKPTCEELERKIEEQGQIICKLHRMNQSAAEQAVAGCKMDLADALKSVVEDARLPEAKTDPEIASALLEDMLGILRWKGIIKA